MKHPEQDLQRSVAQYLDAVLAKDVLWTAIGHGGGGKIRGAMLKGMGLKRGVPDIYIAWDYFEIDDSHQRNTVWIELKAATGRQSQEQHVFEQRAAAIGHKYTICKSVNDVASALEEYGVPTRETKR